MKRKTAGVLTTAFLAYPLQAYSLCAKPIYSQHSSSQYMHYRGISSRTSSTYICSDACCIKNTLAKTLPLFLKRHEKITPLFQKESNDDQENDSVNRSRSSKRKKFLNLLGLNKTVLTSKRHETKSAANEVDDGTNSKKTFEAGPFEVTTLNELDDYFNDVEGRFRRKKRKPRKDNEQDERGDIDFDALLASLSVKGETQIIGSADHKDITHPVVQLLHERKRQIDKIKSSSTENNDNEQTAAFRNKRNVKRVMPPDDGFRVALIVEGGGMRGCVTAGMVVAIHYLGLEDTVDVVYGSSAGTVIGAYFITRQLPWFGPEVYYDSLTTAGDQFINTKRLLRAVGLGLLDPRLTKDVLFRRNNGKPVLDLSYLLVTTMQEKKPLDWEAFEEMQKVQPLKVMASGLRSQKAVMMDMERGSFHNIQELASCMRASCLLPGLAGPVMNLKSSVKKDGVPLEYKLSPGNNADIEGSEPLADSLLYAPIPFQQAILEGATHVVTLRSRPDGVDVTGKVSLFEKLILRRFFLRKNRLRNIYEYMRKHLHKKLYAEQVIILNEGAGDVQRKYSDVDKPHLLPIAIPPGSDEVTRLESDREAILNGVRRGFARAYDALVEDVNQRGEGANIAYEVFPDEILSYDPLEYTSESKSAFETYLDRNDAAH